MKAAAEVAATYGIICKPQDMTNDEAFIGLMANMTRIRAAGILDHARSISVAMNPEDGAADLLAAIGVPKRDIMRSEFERMRSAAISRMESKKWP